MTFNKRYTDIKYNYLVLLSLLLCLKEKWTLESARNRGENFRSYPTLILSGSIFFSFRTVFLFNNYIGQLTALCALSLTYIYILHICLWCLNEKLRTLMRWFQQSLLNNVVWRDVYTYEIVVKLALLLFLQYLTFYKHNTCSENTNIDLVKNF